MFERAVANLQSFYRLKISRRSLTITCLILAGSIGYIDYVTGYEHSMLLFYFLPISLAAWSGSFAFGITMVVLCVMTGWVRSGIWYSSTGILEHWNGVCLVHAFAGVVSKLGTLVRELDRRVDERTAAYSARWLAE